MTVYDPNVCPYCGDPVDTDAAGAGHCDACERFVGRYPVPAVECTVVKRGGESLPDDRALVVKRAAGRNIGTWGLPGGHLEPGDDSPAGAAVRELEEETGVSVDADDVRILDALLEENDDGSTYLTVGFVADAADADGKASPTAADPDEVSAVRYVNPTTFDGEMFRLSDVARLGRAIERVESGRR